MILLLHMTFSAVQEGISDTSLQLKVVRVAECSDMMYIDFLLHLYMPRMLSILNPLIVKCQQIPAPSYARWLQNAQNAREMIKHVRRLKTGLGTLVVEILRRTLDPSLDI